MEAFTSQSLSAQAGGNPFSQPSLLAELIIPYIESYRSTADPRELVVLQYPSYYLSTIIALRELLGYPSLHVAAIVNGATILQSQLPIKRSNSAISPRRKTSTRRSDRLASPSVHSQTRSNDTPQASAALQTPFSKADFLLSNTATENEISIFISSLSKDLTQNYSFYAPDTPLDTSSPSSPTMSSASSHPPYTPPSPKRTFFSPMSESHPKITMWSGEAAQRSFHQNRQLEKVWDDFYADDSGIEDELERIFMPQLPASSRDIFSPKAFKWLGLS